MKKFVLISIGLYITLSLYAQEEVLTNLVNHPYLQNANIGILVKDLSNGHVLANYRSRSIVPPASTLKIVTTATALEILGSDFRFPTYIETDGKIINGVLKGNLYIRGTGDPTLGSTKTGDPSFLYTWVHAIRETGIHSIEGNVIADVTFFDGNALNPQWLWEDIGNYYAPGIFALPYLDNTLNIQLRSTSVGSVADVIKTLPPIEGLTFENHIRCTSITHDGAYVHGVPYSNTRYLVGSIPSNKGVFGVRGDIPNPPLLLAQHFTQRLSEAGISVTGEASYITEGVPTTRTLLYKHLSPCLNEIVTEINHNSNNLYAEQVFRYFASRIAQPCTIHNAIETERICWYNRGIDLRSCFIMDGCGLAPQDGISAEILVQILSYMLHSKNADTFYASLPVAGKNGTLKGFLKDSKISDKIHAKSGTTSRIKSYAGYMNLPNGNTAAFALIINNASCSPKTVQKLIENFIADLYVSQTNP